MGNDESATHQQTLPLSPVIRKLKNTLHLHITSNKTNSFVHQEFATQIKKQSGFISRTNNPFFSMISLESVDNDQNYLLCCLISPIMAITSQRVICDQTGKYCKKVKLLGMTKKQGHIQATVKQIITFKETSICLLLLSQSIIDLGWAGINCLSDEEEIENEAYKIMSLSKCEDESGKELWIYKLQMSKAFYKKEKGLIGRYKSKEGSLVFRVIDKKPYIVGVHMNDSQAQFISKDLLQKINETVLKQINVKREREILSNIDIEKLQLMEKL